MEVSEVLTKAWAAVVESGVPPEMQETAFKAAIDLIMPAKPGASRPNAAPPSPPAAGAAAGEEAAGAPAATADTEALFRTLATESGIDQTALEEVFYFDPATGAPHINVAGRKLGTTTTSKTQAIATGLSAVNYYVTDQPNLSIEVVRAECQAKSAYDQPNFNRHIGSAPGVTLSGSGASRVFRVKPTEIEAAFRAMVNTARGIVN